MARLGSPIRLALALILGASCACNQTPATRARREIGAASQPSPSLISVAAAAPAPVAPASQPLYPPEIRSLKLKKSAVAYVEPDDKSRVRGTIAADTRVAWRGAQAGRGCTGKNRWVEVIAGGWVCDKWLEPSKKEPGGVELPKIPPGKLIPGDFATIDVPKGAEGQPVGYASVKDIEAENGRPTGGAWKCMLQKPGLSVKGKSYLRTDCGLIFEQRFIRKLSPSDHAGVKLEEAKVALPLVFVAMHKADTTALPTGGKKVKTYKGRTALPVLEIKVLAERGAGRPPRRAYRVGEHEWLSSTMGNLAAVSPPPAGVGPTERWVDINTDEQVLIGYEGAKPVFATVISSGKEVAKKGKEPTPTKPGVYRIYHKFAETKMSGLSGTDESYMVSKVPWTQYFSGDLALHGAYWHNGFGKFASHGCVNLAPKDARFLYFWTDPQLPPGWSMMGGSSSYPGSVVRVRNTKAPDPPVSGYAKKVLEMRQGKATAAAAPGAEPSEAPAMPAEPGESARGTP
ncbi:MAG TPA: L,D-transpeptidase [Polyangia bacterium]|jgi:lipoprotein-anchoring transpeptidase ErfK/SrfK